MIKSGLPGRHPQSKVFGKKKLPCRVRSLGLRSGDPVEPHDRSMELVGVTGGIV